MKTFNQYYPQGPRDQENEREQSREREEGLEHNRPGTTTNPEEDPRIPTVTPETDDGGPAARGKDGIGDNEELIPIKKDEEDLAGDEEEDPDEDEDEMEDDELDEEEDDMDEDEEDDEMDSEPGRDTRSTNPNPGDEFTSPANNPNEANFEDPAQNRKTDPMTDHEPRVEGI